MPRVGSGPSLFAKVLVGAVDPVFARWSEGVEGEGIFEGEGGVGDVGRDEEKFAGAEGNFLAFDGELQSAGDDLADLFVVMAVHGDETAFLHGDASDHDFIADDVLAVEEGIDVFGGDLVPADVLNGGLAHQTTMISRR